MVKYDIDMFYKNMRKNIEEKGISLKEIYSAIGMAQSNFSNAYNRKNGKRFNIEQMLQIAEYLNCSLDEMFSMAPMEKTMKYLQIPDIGEWTCKDLLNLVFSLRKTGCKFEFADVAIKDRDLNYNEEFTSIYFTQEIEEEKSYFSTGRKKIIDSIIKEWCQIIESTKNIDAESRDIMLDRWEEKKLEQVQNIKLSGSNKVYKLDEDTKVYGVAHVEDIPFE